MFSALIAEEPPAPPQQQQQQVPFILRPEVMLGLVVLFIVVVVLPAGRRQRKDQEKLLATLKNGSKVLLSSGIVGTVVSVRDGEDELVVRSEDSKFRVKRNTVVQVVAGVEAGK